MHTSTRLALIALLAATAACGAKPQPEQPLPQQQPQTPPAINADSARQAQEAADRQRRLADSLAAAARDSAMRASTSAATAAARAEAERMFADQIHFEYDKFDVRPEDQGTLDWKVRLLLANPSMTVRISGHADDRGSDEYNLALGNRRAGAAKRYLVNKGVPEGRIVIDSYGEERPLDTAATEEAWAKNRRDEFVLSASPAIWSLPRP